VREIPFSGSPGRLALPYEKKRLAVFGKAFLMIFSTGAFRSAW
jgi:hypothetical protein